MNVSGFSNPHNSAIDIPIFSALGIFSIASQLIIMNFVYTKNVPYEKSTLKIMNKAMLLSQLVCIKVNALDAFRRSTNSMDKWYAYLWMLGGDILVQKEGHSTKGTYWFPAYNSSAGVSIRISKTTSASRNKATKSSV